MKREVLVFIKDVGEFLYACQGTGDNLLDEDIEEGYVDYVNIETYLFNLGGFEDNDGGMKLLEKPFDEYYKDDDGTQLIKDAMDMVYGVDNMEYVVLG